MGLLTGALGYGAAECRWISTCDSVWGRVAGLRQTVAPGAASLVTCHPPPCPTPPPPPPPPLLTCPPRALARRAPVTPCDSPPGAPPRIRSPISRVFHFATSLPYLGEVRIKVYLSNRKRFKTFWMNYIHSKGLAWWIILVLKASLFFILITLKNSYRQL